MAEPILKWAGGKRQILDALKEALPPRNEVNRYHEPFVGGGALFFDIEDHDSGSTINDINERLTSFYQVVADHPDKIIKYLDEELKRPHSDPDPSQDFSETGWKDQPIDKYYYQQRERFNRRPRGQEFDQIEEAALLLYLNRTCYNGLYRENTSGEFNVPIGRHQTVSWRMDDRIRRASEILSDVEIRSGDFGYITDVAEPNDLVYFDPPYKPVSRSSSFVEYHHSGFGEEEQDRLRDVALELVRNNVWVVISNSPPMETKYNKFDDFYIHDVGARRQINSDPDDRDKIQEIIVTNVPKDNRRVRMTNLDNFGESGLEAGAE